MPQIKLPLLIKHRPLNIRLDDKGLLTAISPPFTTLHDFLNLLQILANFDPLPAVRALPRFDYPKVELVFVETFDFLGSAMEVPLKLEKSWILHAFGNVERKREIVEGVFLAMQVVAAHGVEQGLLVADDVVVSEVVVHSSVSELLWSDHLAVFEVFEPQQQSLVAMLLSPHVILPIAFNLLYVAEIQNTFRYVLPTNFISFWPVLACCLDFEVLVFLELSPHEVSLLDALSVSEPKSSVYQSSHHAGVVALSDIRFQSMLVLEWRLNEELVC